MTHDIQSIRARMRGLTARATRTIRLADAGTIGDAELAAMVAEMNTFLEQAHGRLLDLADRAEANGDQRLGAEFYETAMEIEAELLRGAPPVAIGVA
jgi:hypothetical protein